MEEALAKIRPHTSSKLAHQKAPATLLHAIEATFSDQDTQRTPTAYFAALVTTLDATLQRNETSLEEGDVFPAELYLLALVLPFVPSPVIRAQLQTLLSLTAPLFPLLIPHAPPLRSQLTLYHTLFLSVDRSQLGVQGLRQSFASVLSLCSDPRPKVRKKAAEIVRNVLASPPPPLVRHPYAERAAEWVRSSLAEIDASLSARSMASRVDTTIANSLIHLLALLRPILPYLPPSTLPSIINLLMSLPHASPASPEWLLVIGSATFFSSQVPSDSFAAVLIKVWSTVWSSLESADATTRNAAAQSLDTLVDCITQDLIEAATEEGISDSPKSTLSKMIALSTKTLDSLAYANSIPHVLGAISSLIKALRFKSSRSAPTATEILLLPTIQKIGELRISKGFEHKNASDAALATAMQTVGPEVLLRVLPLNLEPGKSGAESHAYLLPMLAHPHPSPLAHFVSYFVPLSKQLFDLQQKAGTEGRASEAKMWNVLIAQIWAGLSGYCWGTVDLRDALTPAFSQILSQLLYSQPELRPSILKALKIMVDSNLAISRQDKSQSKLSLPNCDITPAEAAENIIFLRTQAESWLYVLFNIFESIGRDGRGMVGEVISAWASIANNEDTTKAYRKVAELLETNLGESTVMRNSDSSDNGSITAIMQDILLLLIPYLTSADATTLFQLSFTPHVLGNSDNGVQKRGYRILARLIDSEKVTVDAESTIRMLNELSDALSPSAKKDRFVLLDHLIILIPATAMHLIPSLISEAILGTKEASEKARSAAFDLIVAMGRKMSQGGVVKKDMIDGMMDQDYAETTASIEEYMTMVAAGLTGTNPHTISATMVAISRLVFEFKGYPDAIPPQMHTEILTTLLTFLSSPSREILKSALGFFKLIIHILPIEIFRPHLETFITTLLSWPHDRMNHFKMKVRHIFERLIRRFGWESVYACAGNQESSKMLLNIKKRRDRAKRKKAHRMEDHTEGKPGTGDAFEDVLYSSEGELDSDDPDEGSRSKDGSRSKERGFRLPVDNDEPMDLLHGAISRIAGTRKPRRRKSGQDATDFKVNEETGKIVIVDESDDESVTMEQGTGFSGIAHRESMTSADGVAEGSDNISPWKDTKKRRRANRDDDDIEMADDSEPVVKDKKSKLRKEKIGGEFKAKKAGGDIKKGNIDPYAYVPLSQAAKNLRGRQRRISIA